MKMYVFEGTPDEISGIFRELEPSAGFARSAAKHGSVADTSDKPTKPPLPLGNVKPSESYYEKRFVTVDFAREVMTRLDLSSSLKAVLLALRAAHPQWVPIADLYAASGYEGQRFAGLMGAFGRRMKHTKGYDDDAHFFDFDWDNGAGAWRYRLPENVLEAMRLESIA